MLEKECSKYDIQNRLNFNIEADTKIGNHIFSINFYRYIEIYKVTVIYALAHWWALFYYNSIIFKYYLYFIKIIIII